MTLCLGSLRPDCSTIPADVESSYQQTFKRLIQTLSCHNISAYKQCIIGADKVGEVLNFVILTRLTFTSRRHGLGSKWERPAADDSPADFGSDAGSVAVPERDDTTTCRPHQHSTCPDHYSTGTEGTGAWTHTHTHTFSFIKVRLWWSVLQCKNNSLSLNAIFI